MKIAETPTTVTTLDVTVRADHNLYGGSPLQILAIVITTERWTFTEGPASESTKQAHAEVLAKLGWQGCGNDQPITRGIKTVIELCASRQTHGA